MKNSPLISVILTSYNQKPQLERALKSLLDQTYKNTEIIIVDDCSTDGKSIPFIEEAEAKYDRVKSFIQPVNVGIPRNKNTGFKMANGEYITYLDGDDFYYDDKIEKEYIAFQDNPRLDVVFSNFKLLSFDLKEEKLWNADSDLLSETKFFKKIVSRDFPYKTVFRYELIKSETLKKIGYYDEAIRAFHDWDSRIRYSSFANVGYCDNVGSAYINDPNGISKGKDVTKRIREIELVYNKNKHLLSILNNKDALEVEKKIAQYLFERRLCQINSRRNIWRIFPLMCTYPYKFGDILYRFKISMAV